LIRLRLCLHGRGLRLLGDAFLSGGVFARPSSASAAARRASSIVGARSIMYRRAPQVL
jgi:hypothetical protein